MIKWLHKNKEWVLSGVGVAIISAMVGVVGKLTTSTKDQQEDNYRQEISSGDESTNIQLEDASGDISINVSPPLENFRENQNTELEWFKIEPISHLDEKLNAIRFESYPPNIRLRFISERWDIDHELVISKKVPISKIKHELMTRLTIEQHLEILYSNLPKTPGFECPWKE